MFACIYVPDFPVEAIVRAEPLLRERAVAVLEGKPPLVRVVALNEKARLLGMEIGMTKLQAEVFAEANMPPVRLPPITSKARIAPRLSAFAIPPCCASARVRRKTRRIALCSMLPMLLLRVWKMQQPILCCWIFREWNVCTVRQPRWPVIWRHVWRKSVSKRISQWLRIRMLPCMRLGDLPEPQLFQPEKKRTAWECCLCRYCWTHSTFLHRRSPAEKSSIQ